MFMVCAAYFSVLRFSSKFWSRGERHAIMSRKELPPKACWRSEVSLDSRNGTCSPSPIMRRCCVAGDSGSWRASREVCAWQSCPVLALRDQEPGTGRLLRVPLCWALPKSPARSPVRQATTLRSTKRDWLMLAASCILDASAHARSEPARSTNVSTDFTSCSTPQALPRTGLLRVTASERIACDREECVFIEVAATFRCCRPAL
mmetsp:Transcript_33192/g.98625  ORF Transcript_33192/g.98625 Transcript_33192/m.98625 type:complete len:204 (-) Transcript_33192:1648-2259(-)